MAQSRKTWRLLSSLALGILAAAPALSYIAPAAALAQAGSSTKDTIIFRSGQTVEGKILEETATTVKILVDVRGITSEASYDKSQILSIQRAPEGAADPAKANGAEAAKTDIKPAEPTKTEANAGAPKVYVMELEGWFGEEISETPIRQAAADAKRQEVDYIIVMINNDWSLKRQGQLGDIKDDAGAFDQLFRAEDIEPIFTEEIPAWSKPPKVIFWVKKAMGGAAFLPFSCKDIYFSSEGKMGGVGHLTKIFGSTGSERVREKQFSLRMGHAEGILLQGGYDPKLIRAMARDDYVLSYRMEGGKAVLLERMPESPDETLLTDDAKDGNVDDIESLARGEGNDVLTLNADLAYKLGVSKGTADTLEDLLFELGLSRNHNLVKTQSASIMKVWRDGVENGKRRLTKLWEDFGRVEVAAPGGYQERTQARGRQKSIINEMQGILRKYEEAINAGEVGVPNYEELEIIKKQIEMQQTADQPDGRR